MRRIKLLIHIIRTTGFSKFTLSFISFLFLSGGILCLVEPSLTNYGDSLWYAFISATTVGYGDFVATTFIGRMVVVCLTIYGLLFFGCLSAVIINYYNSLAKKGDEGDE